MNESRIYTKQNLRGSRTHSLTGWSEQQNLREDKTIGRLLHRCSHVHLLLHILFENNRLVYVQIRTSLDSHMPNIHQYRLSYDDDNRLTFEPY